MAQNLASDGLVVNGAITPVWQMLVAACGVALNPTGGECTDRGSQIFKPRRFHRRGRQHFRVGRRPLFDRFAGFSDQPFQRAGFDLVGLGQHDLVGNRGLVEQAHNLNIARLDAVARIDQHI